MPYRFPHIPVLDEAGATHNFEALQTLLNAGLGAETLKAEAVTESKLGKEAVSTAKIAKEAVTATKLAKQEAWNAATLKNSWTVFSARTPAYVKDLLGWVHMRGQVTGGITEKTVTELPAGYRPGFTQVFPMSAVGTLATGAWVVEASGVVLPSFAAGANFDLSTIVFFAEN